VKEKITDFLKRVKVLWDAYKVLLGVLALFGALGSVGYYSTEKAPPVASKEVSAPLPVETPKHPSVVPQYLSKRQIEDICIGLIDEYNNTMNVPKPRQESWAF
jgi:hypothetical protein